MRRIIRADLLKGSVFAMKGIIILSTLTMITVMCIAVILRYVFKHPLLGMEEIALMLMLWLWAFGMAYSSERDFHIFGGLPTKRQSIVEIKNLVYPFICLVVSIGFLYLTYVYCLWTIEQGVESLGLRIPWIYSVAGLFLGLLLNSVYLSRQAVIRVRAFRKFRQERTK